MTTNGKRSTKRKPAKQPLVLSSDEVARMLAACSTKSKTGKRTRALITIMAGAGLRSNEATHLRPCDVKWGDNLIEVRNGKGQKDRTVPIHPDDLTPLRAWDEKRPGGARYFFTTHKGGRLSNRYVRQAIKRTAIRAKLENAEQVHPHTLRHSFATNNLERGRHIAEVRDMLGHDDASTTSRYLHVRPRELARRVAEAPSVCSPVTNAVQLVTNTPAPTRANFSPEVLTAVGQVMEGFRALPRHERSYLLGVFVAEMTNMDGRGQP